MQNRAPAVVLDNVFRGETRPFNWHYAVLPDAQHFVFARNAEMEPVREIRLIINWFEEIKRLVPTGKK